MASDGDVTRIVGNLKLSFFSVCDCCFFTEERSHWFRGFLWVMNNNNSDFRLFLFLLGGVESCTLVVLRTSSTTLEYISHINSYAIVYFCRILMMKIKVVRYIIITFTCGFVSVGLINFWDNQNFTILQHHYYSLIE